MMIPRLEAKALGSGRTILACAPRPWARYSASLCLGFLACGRGAVGVLQVPGSWAARAPPPHRPEVPPLAAPAASTGRLTCGMAQPTSNSKLHSAQVADFGDEHAAGGISFFRVSGLSLLTIIMCKLHSMKADRENKRSPRNALLGERAPWPRWTSGSQSKCSRRRHRRQK